MSSSHTQIPYLWAFQDIKTLILVFKEIIIWNTKRYTKPQKPHVSGVFLYPLISLRRPEMWWGFLCNTR